MKIDLEQAQPGAFEADVCIAGAGIAGLTLAAALIDSGLTVALLEGGGTAPEARSQDLYTVEMTGHPHAGAAQGRFRIFGGSSTQWGGQLLPYTDDVFHPPLETAMPSWPIGPVDLEPFYPQVLRIMGVPEEPFACGSLASGGVKDADASAGVQVRFSRWAPFTQRNLAGTLGKRCLESTSVTVYLHANVTSLEPDGDAIAKVQACNFSGRKFTFSARHIIVCLGVIESARLLILSSVGNSGDQVGRYFHDHIGVHAATLMPPARVAAIRLFAPHLRSGALYTPKLEATDRWRRQHRTPSVMAHFPIVEPEDSAIATVKLLLQIVQRHKWPPGLLRKLAALPFGSWELLRMAYFTKTTSRRALSGRAEFRLNVDIEQRPSPDSRITLSEVKDSLGLPRARLDWKITDSDERTVHLYTETILAELQGIGVAPIHLHPALLGASSLTRASDTYHMMGGTRMGANSTDSVVDSSLKVHGLQNLYVASCSVFPSGGSSNPTFTLMALTLRLAEQLRRLSR